MVTIDEKLLENAKNTIPNISEFVEKCLKNYLGVGDGLIEVNKQQKLLETIGKCQLELYLMNDKENIEKKMKEAEIENINYTWRLLYTEYRDTRKINPTKLEKAVSVLGVDKQELIDIVEVAFVYSKDSKVDITDWFEVYGEYGEND